jgi:hypothetical protein
LHASNYTIAAEKECLKAAAAKNQKGSDGEVE